MNTNITFKYKGISYDNKPVCGNFVNNDMRNYDGKSVWLGTGDEYNTDWIQIIPETFCEFTNYYDINNNPIYENDKVVIVTDCGGGTSSNVVWNNELKQFVLENPSFKATLKEII